MKRFLLLGMLALLLTASGCATKSYVMEQTEPLNRRVGDLDSRLTALENIINRMPTTLPLAPADRELLQNAAQKAQSSADMAAESAKKAEEAANQAQTAAKKGEKLLELEQKK